MFKHLTFEGVEKKDNKECNIQEKAIIMKEKEMITLQKSINNRVLCTCLLYTSKGGLDSKNYNAKH